MREATLDPRLLAIEVTESILIGDVEASPSAGTSKPSTHGHFKIGRLVAYRPELSSNYSQLADINQFISKIIYLHSVAEGRLSEEAYNFTWRSAQRA